MPSLSPVGRSAAACKNDRVSLCMFTFSDGRRCRTPRIRNHPHFCFYHAQKEARACTAETLGKDLAYFFSGDYLSACDLSTALARLIPAVVRGEVKPRTAHTVAYLVQTLKQAIHISQHEYINAFGTDGWRKSVRNSVNDNYDYLFPPDPEPEQSESLQPQPQPAQPQAQAQQPASAPPSNPSQPAAVAHPFRGEASSSALPPKATPRNLPKYPQVVIPSAARSLLFPPPPPHTHPLSTPHPLIPPVIRSVAKDTASIPPHQPPTRPIPFPQPDPLARQRQPPNPTTHR